MAGERKYKTEPLKCWEEAKALRKKYYDDVLKAREGGGLLISGSATLYYSLPAGLGDDVCLYGAALYAEHKSAP